MAAELNLNKILRGDTVPFSILFKDGADNPINLDGQTLILSFKKAALLDDLDADLTLEIPVTEVDPANPTGLVGFSIQASETSQLIPGVTYHYSISVSTPASPEALVTTYFYGEIYVGDS